MKTTAVIMMTILVFSLCAGCSNPYDPLRNGDIEKIPGDADYERAYQYRTGTPDESMNNLPAAIENKRSTAPGEFIKELADHIVENSQNDFEKVKKAHDWIALNIAYDTESYFSGTYPGQDAATVLTTGLSVCAGYSQLFKALCDGMEIECQIVPGYGRGYSFSLFGSETAGTNHDWNKVKIEGRWYLVDCTWDAGYVSSSETYTPDYKTDYLFLRAEYFIYRHFPEDQADQILARPLSKSAFLKTPSYHPRFFESVEKVDPGLEKVTTLGKKFEIEFTARDGVKLLLYVYDELGTARVNDVIAVKNEGQVYRVEASFTKAGKYLLRLYSMMPGDELYWSCINYGLVIR